KTGLIERQREHNLLVGRKSFESQYDYIVVGAGSAGSVVAARLTQNADINVLLIEAGGPESVVSDMPAMTTSLWGSHMDWSIAIAAQANSYRAYQGYYGRLSQGKVIGGSSTINALAYARGLPQDYDDWDQVFGAKGWNWSEVLPHFKRSEDNSDHKLSDKYHGFDGQLTVESIDNPRLIHRTMMSATRELGYDEIDMNDPTNAGPGAAIQQRTVSVTKDGSRCSSATAFLRPVIDRPNLHIMANTLVTKINFDDNRTAVSVDIYRDGQHSTVKANQEIIVSAGAVNTPKLLMLSGVGPGAHLKSLGIPVVADLPVGDNLHDNPIAFGIHFTLNTSKESAEVLESDVSEYFLEGKGRLSRFEKSVLRMRTSAAADQRPDVQIFADTGSLADIPDAQSAHQSLNLKPDVWHEFYWPFAGRSTVTFVPLLSRPLSRGTVRLASARFADQPVVDPNYYDNPRDIRSMVEGMKVGWSLGQTQAFVRTFDAKPFHIPVPGCQSHWPSESSLFEATFTPSDVYFECVAKTLTNSYTHLSGTCRMGAESDPKAVVDPRLRVVGVGRLRVVDASVAPQSPSGALYAGALMIAEMGSQFILNDYKTSAAHECHREPQSLTSNSYIDTKF
ncbi:unnamed protein product, partial [Medioppia subpectinata]